MQLPEILNWFESHRNQDNIAGKKIFGINVSHCYGISNADLKILAKELKKNQALSLKLWETGSNEAKILASYLAEPKQITTKQMEYWVKSIQSWDVCDNTAQPFIRSNFSDQKIFQWADHDSEFIKRMAFSMIALSAVHQKKRSDQEMQQFFPLILKASIDPRNFIKKAVNWALRQLGKRNIALCKEATQMAKELMQSQDSTQVWIGKNAYKELTDPIQLKRIQKKSI